MGPSPANAGLPVLHKGRTAVPYRQAGSLTYHSIYLPILSVTGTKLLNCVSSAERGMAISNRICFGQSDAVNEVHHMSVEERSDVVRGQSQDLPATHENRDCFLRMRFDSPMTIGFSCQCLAIPYPFMDSPLPSGVAKIMPAYGTFRFQAGIQMDEDV